MKYIVVFFCATLFVLCTGNPSKVKPSRVIKLGDRDTLPHSADTSYTLEKDTVSNRFYFKVDTRSVDTGIVVENKGR